MLLCGGAHTPKHTHTHTYQHAHTYQNTHTHTCTQLYGILAWNIATVSCNVALGVLFLIPHKYQIVPINEIYKIIGEHWLDSRLTTQWKAWRWDMWEEYKSISLKVMGERLRFPSAHDALILLVYTVPSPYPCFFTLFRLHPFSSPKNSILTMMFLSPL